MPPFLQFFVLASKPQKLSLNKLKSLKVAIQKMKENDEGGDQGDGGGLYRIEWMRG